MSDSAPNCVVPTPPSAAETRLAALLALDPDDLDAECFGLLRACEPVAPTDRQSDVDAWWDIEHAYDQYLDDVDFGMLVAADTAACRDSRHWTA